MASEQKAPAGNRAYAVLGRSEAIGIITGKENKESIYRGMQRVYELIIDKTDSGELLPLKKIFTGLNLLTITNLITLKKRLWKVS